MAKLGGNTILIIFLFAIICSAILAYPQEGGEGGSGKCGKNGQSCANTTCCPNYACYNYNKKCGPFLDG
ncbi:Alpha-conotoxin S1 [Orchesella cincta]|uniref:Alpha-conotoxin S1 n=1 Tax=Orchesella cincta TaxID=48709 RepID=A0A1D2M671_ORCCI|nr:Alpha-conotoxin S1 [Orchesella cincta]